MSRRSRMKVGIIGTSHVHAPGFARHVRDCGVDVVAVAESDEEAADRWRASDPAPVVSRDELLDTVDAVVVAGTNRERVDDTIAAIDAGVPVLVEKPVAVSRASLDRLMQVPRSAKVCVALPVRCAPALVHARERLHAGAIGQPLAGRGTNHGQYPGGWFGVRELSGGGAIVDHVVHVADAFCWLLDDRIARVYAESAQRIHDDIDVEDCALLTLDFESGLFASLDASWSRPSSFPTWGDVWLELVGTEGRMTIDPLARTLTHYDDRAGRPRTRLWSGDEMTSSLVSRFLRYAVDEADCPVPLADGIHASEVVLAAQRAATEHVTVAC